MIPTFQLGQLGFSRGAGDTGSPPPPTGDYWNPADKGVHIVLSNYNRTAETDTFGTWYSVRSITSHSSGKWYVENEIDTNVPNNQLFGFANASQSLNAFLGSSGSDGWGIQNNSGSSVWPGSSSTGLTPPIATERNMAAYDAATGKIWLGSKGAWANSGDPAAGTNPTFTITPGTTLYLAESIRDNGMVSTIKNQAGENVYTIPSGFSMWG
ncbi:hypothetical protein J2X06_003382 [Lysobacter niastensis]|uniref:Uncharacterized protein n=1 Tax=Lysobacter niastensis TaxID=380629 RepID=A0ABU1WFI3_9GAMM|nr:hypothetical protein [Lysobacter niastensis]MDR7136164.1 hypothetical protein [Lysobacter niastensis]